jgi:hypothetical protein
MSSRRRFLSRLSHLAAAPLLLRKRTDSGPSDYSEPLDPRRSAIILCDMWDKHWCRGANERVAAIVPKIDPLLVRARAKGVTIIHAPSDTMEFYQDTPARRIQTLFILGVHCVLIRDLTGAMYDPNDRPYLSHARGTELVIEHIERYWCPSTTSAALLNSL